MDEYLLNFIYEEPSSDDEDLDQIGDVGTRNEDYLEQTVSHYSEEEFFNNFRVSRNVATEITATFVNSNFYKDDSGPFGKISADNQVLIFLWYLGHQTASFADVSDRFNITKSSLERIIVRVSIFLSNLSPQVIVWPDEVEKVHIEQQFREKGFPNIIGAIDGSHIEIDKPQNDPDSYINRKGYYSIQMQVVCDHGLKIRDIFIGYPGSVHDSRVFRNSPLYQTLPQKCGQYFLLGDSGYPLQANLLTPFKDRGQLTERQIHYNVQLARNRYVIEHCFGVLKQKFRQLFHIKLRKMEIIVHLIRAACVLHNIALKDEFLLELEGEVEVADLNPDINNEEANNRNAQRIRDRKSVV